MHCHPSRVSPNADEPCAGLEGRPQGPASAAEQWTDEPLTPLGPTPTHLPSASGAHRREGTAERREAVGPNPQWLCSGRNQKASLFQQKKTRPRVGWSVVSHCLVKSMALMGPRVLLKGQPDIPVTACWVVCLPSSVLPSLYTATQKSPTAQIKPREMCYYIHFFFFL